jgi:hypothetical protein
MKRIYISGLLVAALIPLSIVGAPTVVKSQPATRQGWQPDEWFKWYHAPQGSRLLPLKWLQALEQPDSKELFLSDANLQQFQYLNDHDGSGLPVGFAADRTTDWDKLNAGCTSYPDLCDQNGYKPEWRDFASQSWVGLNCAACHTNDITYKGHTLRVDGAPALSDFQGFFDKMLASLKQTGAELDKFNHFANRVFAPGANPSEKGRLRTELAAITAWEQRLNDKNATPLRYGYGRLDAQGHILNKVSLILGVPHQLAGYSSDAPASYPYIWDAPNEDNIEWNGLVKNNLKINLGKDQIGIGALGRNVGEVTGVFAHVDVKNPDSLGGYKSTANVENLILLERQLARLVPPSWPTYFPAINTKQVTLGKLIYMGAKDPVSGKSYADMKLGNCVSCHEIIDRSKSNRAVLTHMQDLLHAGTDIALACNTYSHKSLSGYLSGREDLPFSSNHLKPQDNTATLLTNVAVETIVGARGELTKTAWDDVFGKERQTVQIYSAPLISYMPGITDPAQRQKATTCLLDSVNAPINNSHLAYKARPLDGIWATAPYLHNGSVPTLYDLLLPAKLATSLPKMGPLPATSVMCDRDGLDRPCSRPEEFSVGSREFDPRLVGFVSAPNLPNTFEFHVRDGHGMPLIGNYNSGHSYGTMLNDNERWALIEYLKTL